MKYVLFAVLIIAAFCVGYFIGNTTCDMNSGIVTLQTPLKVSSDKGEGILPKGTVLFYVKGMSEGFDVYKVYINVEGKPLKRKKPEKKWFIAPLIAYIE